jgi:hypothetical protein
MWGDAAPAPGIPLASHAQWGAAGGKDLHLRCCREKVDDSRRPEQMLEVVQDKQHVPLA